MFGWNRFPSWVKPAPVEEPHDHAKYPHRCPYCGHWAFVGLNLIEHEHDVKCGGK